MTPLLLAEKNPTSILPALALGVTDGAVISGLAGSIWACPPWTSTGLAVATPL